MRRLRPLTVALLALAVAAPGPRRDRKLSQPVTVQAPPPETEVLEAPPEADAPMAPLSDDVPPVEGDPIQVDAIDVEDAPVEEEGDLSPEQPEEKGVADPARAEAGPPACVQTVRGRFQGLWWKPKDGYRGAALNDKGTQAWCGPGQCFLGNDRQVYCAADPEHWGAWDRGAARCGPSPTDTKIEDCRLGISCEVVKDPSLECAPTVGPEAR